MQFQLYVTHNITIKQSGSSNTTCIYDMLTNECSIMFLCLNEFC